MRLLDQVGHRLQRAIVLQLAVTSDQVGNILLVYGLALTSRLGMTQNSSQKRAGLHQLGIDTAGLGLRLGRSSRVTSRWVSSQEEAKG